MFAPVNQEILAPFALQPRDDIPIVNLWVPNGWDVIARRHATFTGTKPNVGIKGTVRGFGATLGIGTTDTWNTGETRNTDGPISYVVLSRSRASGGGGNGRLFQKGNGLSGSELLYNSSGIVYQRYNSSATKLCDSRLTASGVVTDQLWHGMAFSQDGAVSIPTIYLDGVLQTNTTPASTAGAASNADAFYIGNRSSGDRAYDGEIALVARIFGMLSPGQLKDFSLNPMLMFAPMVRPIWSIGASTAGTSVLPDVGTIAITGYAPAVDRTQSAEPGVGTITITGYAPTVAQSVNQAVTPDVGTITITGYAPTVTQVAGTNVTPDVGQITITGYAPAVDRTASATPDVGQITITGYAPTVSQASASNSADPDTGTITITGYAPTVTQGGAKVGGDEAGDWVKEKKRKKTDAYSEQTVARKQAVLDAFHGLLDPETPEPVVIEAKSVVESTPLPDLDRKKVQKLLKLWQDEISRREEDDELVMMML